MALRHICMYCGVVIDIVGDGSLNGDTHGICPTCLPRSQKEVDEFVEEEALVEEIRLKLREALKNGWPA